MDSRPRIAVVGASARSAAFSLLRAGCDVVAADLFADADLERACPATRIANYPEGLADWLAEASCDGWLYTGALENYPEVVERMAGLRPLLGNCAETLREIRNPLHLQKVLAEARVHFPETKSYDGTHPGEGEWLHKTGQGASGSGVQRVREPIQQSHILLGACQRQAPRLVSGYWQREIKGTPGSAQYLAEDDGTCTLLGITRQLVGEDWAGAAEFQYCGTFAPWYLTPTATADLTRLGQILSIQYSLRGLFGVDFIFDGERVWVIEVNPRFTAAMEVVERVIGHHLLAKHLNAFGFSIEQSAMRRLPAAGKAVLYAKQPLRVSRQLSEHLLAVAGAADRPPLADIPNADTQIAFGQPILTLLVEGNDLTAVETNLRQGVADLEMQLYRDNGGR